MVNSEVQGVIEVILSQLEHDQVVFDHGGPRIAPRDPFGGS
jgi:hypothetical protein